MKKLNNEDREKFTIILESLNFEKYKAKRGQCKSGRYKQSKTILEKRNLEGQGMPIIIPSNIFDFYTRLEVLLGLTLSGHTDTLTAASSLSDELYKRVEIQNKQLYRNALSKCFTSLMELPGKLLEQIAFKTRSKIEEHILIVMDKSTLEEHLSQPLQTNNKQFKLAVTFLNDYNGIFNVTNTYIKFYFLKSNTDEDGYIQITVPAGAYEIESVSKEIKRIIIDEGYYTEANCPFTIKPNFSTLGFFIEISTQGPVITFVPDDSIREILGFNMITIYQEDNLSPNPVDILSSQKIFLECNIAPGMIFKIIRSGIIHNCTINVDLGYLYLEKF